jgi:hypothetical protein
MDFWDSYILGVYQRTMRNLCIKKNLFTMEEYKQEEKEVIKEVQQLPQVQKYFENRGLIQWIRNWWSS